MIFLKNAVDGFKLIIGSFVFHAVFLIAMALVLRPPEYEDKERTSEALAVYIFLICYHLGLGTIRYWNLFMSNVWRGHVTLWMMLTVVIMVLLCQRWVYVDLDILELKNKRQTEWYVWCGIEIAYFYSTMIGAAIFTFVRSWFPMALRVQGPLLVETNEHVDFLDVESLVIDMFNMVAAPFIISIIITTHCYINLSDVLYTLSPYQEAANMLSFVQMCLFCVGIFTPRGSVWRPRWWNEYMPGFCMLALRISMFVIPPIILGLSVTVMLTEGLQVAQALFALLQVGTIAWFGLDFYPVMVKFHQKCLETQEIVGRIQEFVETNIGIEYL